MTAQIASAVVDQVSTEMQPNILYIHSHDTGRYAQPYGRAVPTPNIQRLAEEGVLFRQAFCASPTCSPSRAALLTGQAPHTCGMLGLAHRGFRLYDYGQHIVNVLRGAGYTSTLIGMQHEAADPAQIGYDQVLPVASASAVDVTPAAVHFLSSVPRQPFFLSVGFAETHRPYPKPGPAEDARYVLPPAPLPDTSEVRADLAAFVASARALDEGVGAVLRGLRDAGLDGNTVVLCTTDHGLAFPGMKCNLTDHGIGVMLVMRGPGGFAGGRVCDALVSQVDVYPTLCELAAAPRPPWAQGVSLLPLIDGSASQVRDELFSEVNYHAAYEPMRAVRTGRWKYIRRFDPRPHPILPNCDDGPSKETWLRLAWAGRGQAVDELYDLAFDPNEAHNLAGDVAHAQSLAEMQRRLAAWMAATGDPLLHGPAPAPHGAVLNDPDGMSPSDPSFVVP